MSCRPYIEVCKCGDVSLRDRRQMKHLRGWERYATTPSLTGPFPWITPVRSSLWGSWRVGGREGGSCGRGPDPRRRKRPIQSAGVSYRFSIVGEGGERVSDLLVDDYRGRLACRSPITRPRHLYLPLASWREENDDRAVSVDVQLQYAENVRVGFVICGMPQPRASLSFLASPCPLYSGVCRRDGCSMMGSTWRDSSSCAAGDEQIILEGGRRGRRNDDDTFGNACSTLRLQQHIRICLHDQDTTL